MACFSMHGRARAVRVMMAHTARQLPKRQSCNLWPLGFRDSILYQPCGCQKGWSSRVCRGDSLHCCAVHGKAYTTVRFQISKTNSAVHRCRCFATSSSF